MITKYKKSFLLFLVLIAVFFLVSCKDNNEEEKDIIDITAEQLFTSIDVNNVTTDINFPAEVNGVSISYISGNTKIISNDGKVRRPYKTTRVEVYAYLKYDGRSVPKAYLFTVIGTSETNPLDELIEYYWGAEGLSGAELKQFLHDLIDDHIAYDYSATTDKLKKTDEDPINPNNIILFYTGRSQAKSLYGSSGDLWNKEHVWAKSHGGFGETKPAGTDLHNLRPTDASVNSARKSLDFDEGGWVVEDTYGLGSTYCFVDSDSFEPRDEVKGDVARILFYMAVRYEGDVKGEPDLELNDSVNNGSRPYIGRISILLKWHEEDPVDEFERHRNEVIYSFQNNRNPFIDYPEFAYLIWGN